VADVKADVATVQENAVGATGGAEDVLTQAVEKVDGVADGIAAEVAEVATDTKGAVGIVANTVAAATDAVEEVTADVAHGVKEVAKDIADAVDATMDAAAAAVSGTMVVEFADSKGTRQRLDFQTQNLGFTMGLNGRGCCSSKANAKVAVKKVSKGGQASALGVQAGWKVCSIDGVEVTGSDQAQQLLSASRMKLSRE